MQSLGGTGQKCGATSQLVTGLLRGKRDSASYFQCRIGRAEVLADPHARAENRGKRVEGLLNAYLSAAK